MIEVRFTLKEFKHLRDTAVDSKDLYDAIRKGGIDTDLEYKGTIDKETGDIVYTQDISVHLREPEDTPEDDKPRGKDPEIEKPTKKKSKKKE
jgi:hypothetical protein